ncbi:uncharacterized protein LOC135495243 [Lineus longissimus]|uniref:uncharacterized protein LOC135495243 n=1 Tax=Lineus longissimus TaxID=88925 RepID=UPI00315D179E
MDKFKVIHKEAKDNVSTAQFKMKARHDAKRNAQAPLFKVGDKVLLKVPRIKPGLSKKFKGLFRGPYIISEILPNGATYRLKHLSGQPVTNTCHADRLKPYTERVVKAAVPQPPQANAPPDTSDDEYEEVESDTDDDDMDDTPDVGRTYTIEKILNCRVVNGEKRYLIKWLGYNRHHNTYEPARNILNKQLIADFENTHTGNKKSTSK